jgi:PPM family protein phosphatase
VLLLGGGAFVFWRYNQSQFYVGVQNGYVAIFRGTNQSVAGISLSSLVQRALLPAGQLGSGDRAGVTQTISKDSVTDADQLVDQIQYRVNQCKSDWQGVAAWPGKETQYQAEVAAASKSKGAIHVPASDNPGPQPSQPSADNCASAAALGVTVPAAAPAAG